MSVKQGVHGTGAPSCLRVLQYFTVSVFPETGGWELVVKVLDQNAVTSALGYNLFSFEVVYDCQDLEVAVLVR